MARKKTRKTGDQRVAKGPAKRRSRLPVVMLTVIIGLSTLAMAAAGFLSSGARTP